MEADRAVITEVVLRLITFSVSLALPHKLELRKTLTFMWDVRLRKDAIMVQYFRALVRDTRGATAIEYGLIAALIAVAAMAAMSSLAGSLNKTFNNVSNKINTKVG